MPGFSKEAAKRIAKVVRRVEGYPVNTVPEMAGPRITTPARYALVTTQITAAVRASSTLGKGIGTLQLVSYDSSDVATYATLGESVPIYSGALSTIATGRLIQVMLVDGRYHVVSDYC